MSEDTATAEAVDTADSVEELPDTSEDQLDFASALDAAFSNLDIPEVEEETKTEEPEQEEPEKQEPEKEEPEKEEPEAEEEQFDPTDTLDEEISDDWTPKAASRFKQLKTELKEATTELHKLRQEQVESSSKLKELTGAVENKDVETLQKRIDEYEKSQLISNLEQTHAYKTAIEEPLNSLVDSATEIAERYNIDEEALIDSFTIEDTTEQDEKLGELLIDATDRDRAKVFRIIEDITPIMERRNAMMENSKEALSEANLAAEKQSEADAAERLQDRQNAARNVASRVQKKLPFLSGIEGLDMEAIQSKAAENDPQSIHPVDFTYNSISAQLLPSIVKEYVGMRKENELLTDRLAEYESSEPTMSGASPSSKQVVDGKPDDRSFEDRVEAAFSGRL